MWLVGCARHRDDVVGHELYNQVWSTTDGATWTRHADPPWTGKIWHNVVVWQGRMWAMFGYTSGDAVHGLPAGNANEVWYSDDGETWQALPFDAPAPGSHAQGVAVTEDALVYAGGNYSFGFGDGLDKSAWRLVPGARRARSRRGPTAAGSGLIICGRRSTRRGRCSSRMHSATGGRGCTSTGRRRCSCYGG
jgi:hypothetical protein